MSDETKTADAPAGARLNDEVGQVPAKFTSIVEAIEHMSVVDLSDLVKVFEKKFGVSAAAVAVAAPGASAASGAAPEEKSAFTVELAESGPNKIAIIKIVKEVLALGLKEAKDIVDGAPKVLKEGLKKVEAEELKKKIEEAGGKVALK